CTRQEYVTVRCSWCFFFLQAEDGIRDRNVTGVQTCALPISDAYATGPAGAPVAQRALDLREYLEVPRARSSQAGAVVARLVARRSEERRVGKEGRARGYVEHEGRRRMAGAGGGTGHDE